MWWQNLDGSILLFLQDNVRMPVLNNIMNIITSLGDKGWLAVLVCLILLLNKDYKKTGCTAAIALMIEVILVNIILKNAVARIRPYYVVEGLTCITQIPHDFSFPSGHTGSSFAVAGAILFNMPKKFGIPALILASFIGFSRLYLGVHYPSDVVAGAVIGIAAAVVAGLLITGGPFRGYRYRQTDE